MKTRARFLFFFSDAGYAYESPDDDPRIAWRQLHIQRAAALFCPDPSLCCLVEISDGRQAWNQPFVANNLHGLRCGDELQNKAAIERNTIAHAEASIDGACD